MILNVEAIKETIGIVNFKRISLLERALTHPSYVYENSSLNRQQQDLQEREYRRLAILGDAIFGAVVTDYLYELFPTLNQGSLTDWKSDLVGRKKAYEFSQQFNLSHYCLLGGSQNYHRASLPQNLLAEMFEALLGAIYLEFESDFSRFRDWLVNGLIAEAVDHLLTEMTEQQLAEANLTDFSTFFSTFDSVYDDYYNKLNGDEYFLSF